MIAVSHSEPAMTLFVAGDNRYSRRARSNLERVLRESRVQAAVSTVDVHIDPQAALAVSVFVTPALLIAVDGRQSLVLGDLSDEQKLLDLL